MIRLTATFIAENDDCWIQLSLKSILSWVDHVYIIYSHTDGDKTLEILEEWNDERITVIASQYPRKSKGADGMQRNKYLDILKKLELGNWNLVLDCDEIVDDNGVKLKALLEKAEFEVYSVKMRHVIYDFKHEDATVPNHWVPVRLFKVTKDLYYDAVEHPVLHGFNGLVGLCDTVTIWHFSHVKHMFDLLKKYKKNLAKSNIHSAEFLRWWYMSHLMGQYPVKEIIDLENYPFIIKEAFEL